MFVCLFVSSLRVILSFMSGLILMAIGILKLGFFVNLFSIPVVSAFTSAAGFTIAASQLKSFFGLSAAPNQMPGVFVKQIINVFERHNEIKVHDVAFGVAAIIFLVVMQYLPDVVDALFRWRNKANKQPVPYLPWQIKFMEYFRLFAASRNVFVFVFSTLAAYLIIRADPAFEDTVSILGHIDQGLPVPSVPRFDIVQFGNSSANQTDGDGTEIVLKSGSVLFRELIVSFVIVPLMIMLEHFAILKSLGRKNGYRIDATNELLAVGLANFLASFIQAFPITVAVTRCALNDQCRVKTLLASLIQSVIVLIAVFALTGTFYYIPKAALAGIIIMASYNLIDFKIAS